MAILNGQSSDEALITADGTAQTNYSAEMKAIINSSGNVGSSFTIGKTTVGSSSTTFSTGIPRATQIIPNQNGILTDILLYMTNSGPGKHAMAGVYADAGGYPGAILVVSSSDEITVDGWHDFKGFNVPVISGVPIWLANMSDAWDLAWYFEAGGANYVECDVNSSTYPNFPNPFPAGQITGNYDTSIYAICTSTVAPLNNGEASVVIRFADVNNFYWAGIGCWGHQYSISRMLNGVPTELASYGSVSSLLSGQQYTIKAEASGNTLTLYVNGTPVLQTNDSSFTAGEAGIRTFGSLISVSTFVTQTTPITPTYIINWSIIPTIGTLPFIINFSGYLSRLSNTPDTSTIVNGETIQLQALSPGSSTWVNTGIAAITGPGTSGNGYFSGTWGLAEPGIYPGPWQFRAYYARSVTKNMFGCDNTRKTRDLRRVNALIL